MSAEGEASVRRFRRICEMEIPPAVKKAGMDMLVKHTEIMANYVRQAVPVDTGRLKHSISTYRDDSLLQTNVRAGDRETSAAVRSGSSVSYNYARAVEFGTADMPAEPYFWPVYRLLKKTRTRAVKGAMSRAIKQLWRD